MYASIQISLHNDDGFHCVLSYSLSFYSVLTFILFNFSLHRLALLLIKPHYKCITLTYI